VIAGRRDETEAESRPAAAQEQPQKSSRITTPLGTAKAAIHTLLVERHADEIDITDREGVRSRITSLADEYVKNAGIALNRLDYGHLIEALLDEDLGLGPLQPWLEDPAPPEFLINHAPL